MDYEFQVFSLDHLRPRSILRPSEGSFRHLFVSYTHHTILRLYFCNGLQRFFAIFLQRLLFGFWLYFCNGLQRFLPHSWLFPLSFYPFFRRNFVRLIKVSFSNSFLCLEFCSISNSKLKQLRLTATVLSLAMIMAVSTIWLILV